ncbi:VanZ family protein [Phenylobacterium sp.]|uniref:VanZ family protein n=1 Tax=Phenylobacterium sp. TaxID=1871053 RepID=UPI0027160433|nr:VanZ family protein [Phenylobacterium sp.]MDO8377589.1 VanZ family protein [Phenylobacterium sp.]
MFLDRFPRPLRLALYAGATAVLLWLCLAPQQDLPSANVGDKIEHSIAWFVLTGTGLLLSHQRPRAIAAYAIGLGALVEVLQATLGFGRQGDWRDLLADTVGVLAALAIYALVRRLRRR